MAELGVMLEESRLRAGFSQNRLARMAGVDPAYVNRLIRGISATGMTRPSLPTRGVVLALANALNLSDALTDRFLFAAGLAPQQDWMTRAIRAETALAAIRQALDDAAGEAEAPTLIRRTG